MNASTHLFRTFFSQFFCLIGLLSLSGCAHRAPTTAAETTKTRNHVDSPRGDQVILISIDGFRTEYLRRGITPVLSALAKQGVQTSAMRPSFPSITFPNHYTLVTGLRPDHHGIVGNRMRDPLHPGDVFTMASKDSFWWNGAEPIWVTCQKNGLHTATLFWPGSESEIRGRRPDDYLTFNGHMTNVQRVDRLLQWYDRPAEAQPRFATLYFNNTDTVGHHSGPDSPEENEAISDADAAIGRLLVGLAQRHLHPNLVIVADHGMAAVPSDHFIALDRIVSPSHYDVITDGAYAGLEATHAPDPALEQALLQPHPHMHCWRKADIPAFLHYGHHPRVPSYVCLAESGWVVLATAPTAQHPLMKGEHGYDPAGRDMSALFIANGPRFLPGKILPPFDNVDIYPLLITLLKLPQYPSDGSLAPFQTVLRPPAEQSHG